MIGNSYDPATHRPTEVSPAERDLYGGEVGFIGAWEAERAETLYYLATNGIRVRIWGGGWHKLRRRHERLVVEKRGPVGRKIREGCLFLRHLLGLPLQGKPDTANFTNRRKSPPVRPSCWRSGPTNNARCSRRARRRSFSGQRRSFCAKSNTTSLTPRSGNGLRRP